MPILSKDEEELVRKYFRDIEEVFNEPSNAEKIRREIALQGDKKIKDFIKRTSSIFLHRSDKSLNDALYLYAKALDSTRLGSAWLLSLPKDDPPLTDLDALAFMLSASYGLRKYIHINEVAVFFWYFFSKKSFIYDTDLNILKCDYRDIRLYDKEAPFDTDCKHSIISNLNKIVTDIRYVVYITMRHRRPVIYVKDLADLETSPQFIKNLIFALEKIGVMEYEGKKTEETPYKVDYDELIHVRFMKAFPDIMMRPIGLLYKLVPPNRREKWTLFDIYWNAIEYDTVAIENMWVEREGNKAFLCIPSSLFQAKGITDINALIEYLCQGLKLHAEDKGLPGFRCRDVDNNKDLPGSNPEGEEALRVKHINYEGRWETAVCIEREALLMFLGLQKTNNNA